MFDWDPIKAIVNEKKHRVSFEMASTVFDDPFHLSILDSKVHHEERWVTIGLSADRRTLVVVHTYRTHHHREEIIRIISARRATAKEARQYEERI